MSNAQQPGNTKLVTDYNYDKFRAELYNFNDFPGPKVGESALNFTATTLEGRKVQLTDFRGKVVVLETGSITCPQYVHRINPMNELAKQYPDVVFLILYVREAHPGKQIGEHHSFEEKMKYALQLTKDENEQRQVIIDDLQGSAHQAYGSLPNMIYVIAKDGTILFRADWNHAPIAAKIIATASQSDELQAERALFRPIPPPVLLRVLNRAGLNATLDFFMALPGLLIKHAGKFKLHAAQNKKS
jgi:peroxiredoxin